MYGLTRLSVLGRVKSINLAFILLIILSSTWLSITNSVTNSDSPLVFNRAVRIGYTQSELGAIRTLSSMQAGRPMTDRLCDFVLPFVVGSESFENMTESESRVFIRRNYYLRNPEWNQYFFSTIHIKKSGGRDEATQRLVVAKYIEEQNIDRWPLIYTNNNVQAYSNAVLILWNR
jgi:hypothetical protein